MHPFRSVLRGPASQNARTALNAVATRPPADTTGLETEKWVAAEVEESGNAMFSEPLTIDELQAARDDFEASFHSASAQGAPALLQDDAHSDASTASTSSDSVDAHRQMQNIQQRSVYNKKPSMEYLDAAVMVAQDSGVQQAMFQALMKNPDAQAALQRGLAQEGISINMQRLQSLTEFLPPSAAAISSSRAGVEVTDVTDEPVHEPNTPNAPEKDAPENDFDLKEALDKITAEVVEKLATFGGKVRSVLHGVMNRWRNRIQGLLNPGRPSHAGKHGQDAEADSKAVNIVDGILSAAALIITIALFKRLPMIR